jgi:hypothetical protein
VHFTDSSEDGVTLDIRRVCLFLDILTLLLNLSNEELRICYELWLDDLLWQFDVGLMICFGSLTLLLLLMGVILLQWKEGEAWIAASSGLFSKCSGSSRTVYDLAAEVNTKQSQPFVAKSNL